MIEKLFFELVRVAISNQEQLSRVPTAREWEGLYQMAQKQALIGVCFAGVQKLAINHPSCITNLSESVRLQWMGQVAKIQQRNEIVNQHCIDLQRRLSTDGYRSCLLKGQSNAANYGLELGQLRQSGDIDLWVEGGSNRIVEYVSKVAPTDEINQHHVQFKVFDDTEVELHFYPLKVNNPWKQKVLDRFSEKQSERQFANAVALGNGRIITATSEFNLVFQMMHIYHHLFTEGVGLRQLMDYYFVLRKVQEVQRVQGVIAELGLNRFASALMWVLGHVFVLPKEQMPWKPNDKDGKFLLNEIMLSGNFGKLDERQKELYSSKWNSFWIVHMKTFRFWRYDHWAWLWSPVERVNGFLWRKKHGYKQ